MSKLTAVLHDIVHHLPIRAEKQEELHQAIDEAAQEGQKPSSAAAKGPKAE